MRKIRKESWKSLSETCCLVLCGTTPLIFCCTTKFILLDFEKYSQKSVKNTYAKFSSKFLRTIYAKNPQRILEIFEWDLLFGLVWYHTLNILLHYEIYPFRLWKIFAKIRKESWKSLSETCCLVLCGTHK